MYIHIKRILDFTLALICLVLLCPVFILLLILIKIDSKGPIFFRQKRVGKDKSIFKIIKFRTMRIDTPHDTPTHLLKEPDQYITRLGAFLRRSSLDELPQLINILLGDMSFVSPRPALWNQYDLIAERDKYVGRYGLTPNQIRPGLTGWAQINGRDELHIAEKAKYDGEYVAKMSIGFDLKCLCLTVLKVVKREGIVEGETSR